VENIKNSINNSEVFLGTREYKFETNIINKNNIKPARKYKNNINDLSTF
jgi:hypothetical protein